MGSPKKRHVGVSCKRPEESREMLGDVSGPDFASRVWFAPAASPEYLRLSRDRTALRAGADSRSAHADHPTTADHSAVSPPNLCPVSHCAALCACPRLRSAKCQLLALPKPWSNPPDPSLRPTSSKIPPARS